MTELEATYQLAHDENIDVYNYHFSATKKAACVYGEGVKAIALDKPNINSRAEECEILGEELMHYETGNLYVIKATSNSPIARGNRRLYETRTLQAYIKKVFPPERLQQAITKAGEEYWQIAEYCGHTIEFVARACAFYKSIGISFKLPDNQ
jgi:hypothetical protein